MFGLFQLALANPPTEGTLAHALACLISLAETSKEPETLTWKKILEGEPFTACHLEASRIGVSPIRRAMFHQSVLSLDSEDLDLDDSLSRCLLLDCLRLHCLGYADYQVDYGNPVDYGPIIGLHN